jgi:16S rRNA (uracil1498-N3)-methyltransferase
MTRRRWIADTVSGDQAALLGDHALHLIKALRARVGQEFDVIANGVVRSARVVAISDARVDFLLGDRINGGLVLPITVLLSIFKFDRMEWALEKCTELGVARIIPIIADRTETHLASASGKRLQRWRRLVTQASEQSRRTSIPELSDACKVKEAAEVAFGKRIVLAETEDRLSLWQALQSPPGISDLAVAIGPEGGWTNRELQLFQETGWVSATLGDTILRVETAAIAAVSVAAAATELQKKPDAIPELRSSYPTS